MGCEHPTCNSRIGGVLAGEDARTSNLCNLQSVYLWSTSLFEGVPKGEGRIGCCEADGLLGDGMGEGDGACM